jgi:hypothetical protein
LHLWFGRDSRADIMAIAHHAVGWVEIDPSRSRHLGLSFIGLSSLIGKLVKETW